MSRARTTAVFGTVVAVSAFVVFGITRVIGSNTDDPQPSTTTVLLSAEYPGIDKPLRNAEAVISVESVDPTPMPVVTGDFEDNAYWVTVGEVHRQLTYSEKVAVSPGFAEYPAPYPILEAGDRIIVREISRLTDLVGAGDGGIVFLSWRGDDDAADSPWKAEITAVVTPWGLDFLGGGADYGDFDTVAADLAEWAVGESERYDASAQFDALISWFEEFLTYPRYPYGPTTAAYRSRWLPADRTEAWLAIPVEQRGLDLESTPEEILGTLDWRTVLIEVDPQAVGYVVIQTDLGISHAADLAIGEHPATVLTPTETIWEVEVRSQHHIKGVTVATIDIGALGEGESVLIVIDASDVEVALAARPGEAVELSGASSASVLTLAEFRERIDQMAERSIGSDSGG
ncbi:hypothetical protein HQ535_04595 [bacterium]|nr:hypothetical protein [bacterium]